MRAILGASEKIRLAVKRGDCLECVRLPLTQWQTRTNVCEPHEVRE